MEAIFAGMLERTDGLAGDLFILKGIYKGEKLELKTDFVVSPNLFVENESVAKDKNNPVAKIGGPVQAKSKNNKFFGFFAPHRKKVIVCETDILLNELPRLIAGKKLCKVKNQNGDRIYFTTGWAVPFENLLEISSYVLNLDSIPHVQIEDLPNEMRYTVNEETYAFKKRFLGKW